MLFHRLIAHTLGLVVELESEGILRVLSFVLDSCLDFRKVLFECAHGEVQFRRLEETLALLRQKPSEVSKSVQEYI